MNSLGNLESNIYRDAGIRPEVYDLFEDEASKTGRVVVIEVPPRPVGKVFKFEDVPLMRVGEDLLPMDDKTYLSIITTKFQSPSVKNQKLLKMSVLQIVSIRYYWLFIPV